MSTFTKSHNWGSTKVIMTSVHIVLYYRKHTRLVIADRKRAGLNQFSRQLKQWYPIKRCVISWSDLWGTNVNLGDSLSYLPYRFPLIFLPFTRLTVKYYDHLSVSCNYTLLNNVSVYTWPAAISVLLTPATFSFLPTHTCKCLQSSKNFQKCNSSRKLL